jgi:hypothetical protein
VEYWKVEWHHDFAEDPVLFVSEIAPDGYEVRKVQGYRDGRLLKADAEHETAGIALSEVPVGSIEEVTAQAEFSAWVIRREEFSGYWDRACWAVPAH